MFSLFECTKRKRDGSENAQRIPDLSECEPRRLMDAVPIGLLDDQVVTSDSENTIDKSQVDGTSVHAPLSGSDNSEPISTGLPWVLESEDANDRVILLHDFFVDADQPSSSLEYRIQSNSAPELFSDLSIDSNGNLTLDFARDAFGEAEIVIRAIDSDGAAVEDTLVVTLLPLNDRPITTGPKRCDSRLWTAFYGH